MALADDLTTRFDTLSPIATADLTQWYNEGYWHQHPESAWYPTTGVPALLATMAARGPGGASHLALMIETFDRVIAKNQIADGRFGGGIEGPSDGVVADDIATAEAAAMIGWAMLQLGAALDANTRARWLASLKAASNYFQTNGNLTFYVNGNVQVCLWTAFYFTYRLCLAAGDTTGAAENLARYEASYAFSTGLGTATGAGGVGHGLVIDVAGVAYDWSDATVFLTETNSVLPNTTPTFGYDGYYSHLQLEFLCRLYVIGRDHRILRLINGISNKVIPFWNTATWIADGSNGSRQNAPSVAIYAPVVPVVRLLGHRATNLTQFTDAKALSWWDVFVIPAFNTSAPGQNLDNGWVPPAVLRSYALTLATTRHAAFAARLKL